MRRLCSLALFVCLSVAALGQSPESLPFRNPELPAAKRAADLVSRMTLEEKVRQMQNAAPAIARLGIPAYDWWNEALHGVARAGQATVFPQAIGLAATWDTGLMNRIADVISTEARAKYHDAIRHDNHERYYGLTFWSPNINIFRDPRWGRGQETYGEDPFLTSRLAVAFIRGMQGSDPHYFKVIATAKHFAVHSGPETSRHQFDAVVSERDLNDTYLPAFRASITEGKADSVMCAYNRIDGAPACASDMLLKKYLRGDWGFTGYVVSDCGAITDINQGHKYKPTLAEASAVAVKTGTDLTCGNEYRSLVDAVKHGQISEAEIDRSLERLFVARFKLGMFDPDDRVPFAKIPYAVVDSDEHRQLSLEAARKSIVLLKNENGTLPLKAVKSIAVIGPSADDPEALLGNYNGFSTRLVTPLAGLRRQFDGKAEVRFALGAPYTTQSSALITSDVLTPPAGRGHGLLAEYFDNRDYQGQPRVSRVEDRPWIQPGMADAALAAAFPLEPPAAGARQTPPYRRYYVRWTGTLRVPASGEYTFVPRGGYTRPAMRVFIDDKQLAESPAQGAAARRGPHQLAAELEAGHGYSLRVEYDAQAPEQNAILAWIPPAGAILGPAIDLVKNADVTVAFVGLHPSIEGEEMPVHIPGFSGGDRTSLDLPEAQERLVEAAIATGKPVVVVLTTGSALAANYAAEHAPALLEAWYGGEEIGTAIAETLAGRNNPAGRLPVTFYRGVQDLPPFEDYAMKGHTYRYYNGETLFRFGYGLSYSKFAYSRLRAKRSGGGATVSVTVKNTSPVDGDEVVQLYVEGAGGADDPIRELRGFERVHLGPGQSRTVQFTLGADQLPKNKVKIAVGGGQPVGQVAHVSGTL